MRTDMAMLEPPLETRGRVAPGLRLDTDRALLALLRDNARGSTAELARKLQLARHLLAVFDRDELVGRRLRRPGQIDRDAQQASGGAFNLHQVITQSGHGLIDDLLQAHWFGFSRQFQSIDQKKRAVRTRPFGREAIILSEKMA